MQIKNTQAITFANAKDPKYSKPYGLERHLYVIAEKYDVVPEKSEHPFKDVPHVYVVRVYHDYVNQQRNEATLRKTLGMFISWDHADAFAECIGEDIVANTITRPDYFDVTKELNYSHPVV